MNIPRKRFDKRKLWTHSFDSDIKMFVSAKQPKKDKPKLNDLVEEGNLNSDSNMKKSFSNNLKNIHYKLNLNLNLNPNSNSNSNTDYNHQPNNKMPQNKGNNFNSNLINSNLIRQKKYHQSSYSFDKNDYNKNSETNYQSMNSLNSLNSMNSLNSRIEELLNISKTKFGNIYSSQKDTLNLKASNETGINEKTKSASKNRRAKTQDILVYKNSRYLHVNHRYLNYNSNLNLKADLKSKSKSKINFSLINLKRSKERIKCHKYNKEKNDSFNYTFLKQNKNTIDQYFVDNNLKSANKLNKLNKLKHKLFKKIEANIIDEGEKTRTNDPFIKNRIFSKYHYSVNFYNSKKFNQNPLHILNKKRIYLFSITGTEKFASFIKSIFQNQFPNWVEANDNFADVNFNFKWNEDPGQIDYKKLSNFSIQLVNHFEFSNELTSNFQLYLNLKNYCHITKINMFDIIPFTLLLEKRHRNHIEKFSKFERIFETISKIYKSKDDLNKINNKLSQELGMSKTSNVPTMSSSQVTSNNMWIYKSYFCIKNKNKKQTKIFDNLNMLHEIIEENDKSYPLNEINVSRDILSRPYIIQKFVENQMLLSGKMINLKIFVLIDPNLKVYLYKESYIKVNKTLIPNGDLINKNTNVGNSIKENLPKFRISKSLNVEYFSCDSFDNYCRLYNFKFWEELIPKIQNIVETTVKSVKYKINQNSRKYCFEIFEYNFIIDSNFNPLIEKIKVLKNPPLSFSLISYFFHKLARNTFSLLINSLFHGEDEDNPIKDSSINADSDKKSEANFWQFICDISIPWKGKTPFIKTH